MSLAIHRQAELLMGQADRLLVQGRAQEAAALYREAAGFESQAFDLIPPERCKTRGIIAISSVALYRKAGALDEAVRQAHFYLARDDLPEFANDDLESLLDQARAERAARLSGRALAPDTFEWVLRGPGVGPGVARLTTVAQKIDQVARYGVRVYEYLAGRPVRLAGPVPPEVRQAFDMMITESAPGSFRFRVRFSVPARQLSFLDADELVSPERVGAVFGEILEAGTRMGADALARVVESQAYRDAFLRLLRALVPDGKELSEVEVLGYGGAVPTATVLTPYVAREITKQLAATRPRPERETTRIDTLRGLNLNEGWILLGETGHEKKCYVREGVVLADIVEGLVDQRVLVTGHWERQRFVIDDVVEATGEINVDEDTATEARTGTD